MKINSDTSPSAIGQFNSGSAASPQTETDEASFGQWLNRSIQNVNQMKNEADVAARKLVSGENKDIHGTMITMQKASIAMNLMTEVRNKIISAYDEIKRMQF
jgi:flagellar hook-basal body complex protein FliE